MTEDEEEEVFYKASTLILREFDYWAGKFASVGLIKITFPVEEIFTVDLME